MAGLKLHVGCGPKYIPGFVHLDALAAEHVDYVGKAEELDMFDDGSVELIYASHILEHFGRHRYESVLAEWYRVLSPGGVLRLAVPDFEVCAKLYVAGRLEGGIEDITGLIVGGQKDEYDYHSMIFDRPSLTATLRHVGFSDVRDWDWRKTEHADIDDFSQAYLPHMQKETGALVSLNLEALK